jgi:predicted transcriptional regulator of viral defense system
MAAWLPLRDSGAVISHESALELHDLSDVIPDAVHVTVPRSERGLRRRDGIRLHTAHRPPTRKEVQSVAGLPVTDPARSIVDSLESGAQPEQIEMAIHQVLDRGLTTPRRLQAVAGSRPERIGRFVACALEEAPA